MRERSGFTIIEMIVALTLLAVVLVGMTTATVRLARTATDSSRATVALGLVQERVTMIRIDPAYPQLEARYAGVESTIDGFPAFTRETHIQAVYDSVAASGRVLAFKRVSVEVDGPGLERPIRRTVAIARK